MDARAIWSMQPVLNKYFGSDLPASILIEVPACSEPASVLSLTHGRQYLATRQMDKIHASSMGRLVMPLAKV